MVSSSLPCCSELKWSDLGHSHRVHSLQPDRSSSGWQHTGRSCDPQRVPCRDRLLSSCGSGTARPCTGTAGSQTTHKHSLRTHIETRGVRASLGSDVSLLLLLTSAVMGQGVAIVTELTMATGRAFGVVQALQTLASSGVT